jgi:hypothetical protein
MTLSYAAKAVPGASLSRQAVTRIFVPQRKYPHGYRIRASNATVVSRPTAPWVQLGGRRGRTVDVTITPRTGSRTRRPLHTAALPLAPAKPPRR